MLNRKIGTPVTFDRVLEIQQRAREALDGFVDFQVQTHFGEFAGFQKLPERPELTGISFGDEMTIRGQLPVKDRCADVFGGILQRGKSIGHIGNLDVECGFEELESKQTRRGYDAMGISILGGRHFFDYGANGPSRVSLDVTYGRAFIERLVAALQLPLRIVDVPEGFALEHSLGRYLWISQSRGPKHENPSGFRCAIAESTRESLLHRMDDFLEVCASRQLVRSWRATPLVAGVHLAPEENASSTVVYDTTVAARLPAMNYDLDLEYAIDRIEGVEAIRKLCGKRQQVLSTLCSFRVQRDEASLQALTSAGGHQLRIATNSGDEDGLTAVCEKLGLT